jgi:hypothetical protein
MVNRYFGRRFAARFLTSGFGRVVEALSVSRELICEKLIGRGIDSLPRKCECLLNRDNRETAGTSPVDLVLLRGHYFPREA